MLERIDALAEELRDSLADPEGNPPSDGLVARVLGECAARYADARVHEFTMVLLERDTRDALREHGLHSRLLTRS